MDNSLSALTTLARNWWAFILRGVIAIGFGLIAWFWPDLALNTLIWLFAIFAFFTGIFAIVAAIRAISQRERWLGLAAEGVIGIGAGIMAVVWPDLTAKTFLYLLAAWAIVTGVLSISSSVRLRKEISGEWVLGLSGVALILFGIIAFARPKSGALAVLWLIGLSAIIFGILWVILGLELRRLNATIGLLNRSVAQSPGSGSNPTPASTERQSGAATSQGIAASPSSNSTATSAAAPAAAAAASMSSIPGKPDAMAGSVGNVGAAMSSTGDSEPDEAISATASGVEDRVTRHEAATGAGAAAVVDHSTRTQDRNADNLGGGEAPPRAEAIAVPTDFDRESLADAVGVEDRTPSPAAAAVEDLPSDDDAMVASESSDHATVAAGAPTAADAMTDTGTPSSADAMTHIGTPSSAEAMTDASATDSGASSDVTEVVEEPESQDAVAVENGAIVVGASSGASDSNDVGLEGVGEPPTAEPASNAQMASGMPRTTRRERALADLVAGLPSEGTGWVLGNGTLASPEGYPLKGNASSRIYHAPGGRSYDVTIAEVCFATASDARSAGFRPRQGDPGAEDSEEHAVESASLPPTDESGVVDMAASGEIGELTESGSHEVTSSDIPSEFVSHLVGDTSTETAADADTSGLGAAGNASADMAEDAAPAGIAAFESVPDDGSERIVESQRTLSRSEQALLDLIATLPPEGTGWVTGTNVYTTPPGYPVKGNASSRIYHLPGGQNYQATIPEICFATVDDARTNGFRPRHGDPAEADWSLVEETPKGVAMGIGHSDVNGAAGSSRAEQQLAEIIAGLPPEGPDWIRGTGVYSTPYGYPIKGNASSRVYHVPGGQNYQATIPEICFVSIDAARAGGFRPRHGDPAEPDWRLVEVTPGSEPVKIAAEPNATDIDPDVAAILAVLPSTGSGWRLGDGTPDCPASYPIKGNASSRIFHVEEGRSFKATIPEFCFATEDDAIAAGFRRARA